MPNPFSKVVIPSATEGRPFMDLSCDHITSQDFFQFQPVLMQPLLPGQTIDINFNMFSRLATLVKPSYANVNIVNRAFFVPYRTIFSHWNNFISDTVSGTFIPKLNYVYESDLCLAVINAMEVVENPFVNPWDVRAEFGEGEAQTAKYYVHTKESKLYLKILNGLGYKIALGSWYGSAYMQNWDEKLNVLPLFAFVKVYVDWYANTQYMTRFSEFVDYKLHSTNTRIQLEDIEALLRFVCNVNYEGDFFVSAWDRPQAPNGNGYTSPITIVDPSLPNQTSANKSTVITGGTEGTPYVHNASSGSAVANFTTTIDHLLHSVTSYLRRHQLAGLRAVDRYLSRFGIELQDQQSNRCSYIGKQVTPVSIADVYSTSDTEGASLGDYSAKGLAYGKPGHFHYRSGEYGVLLVISTVSAKTLYYQGMHPEMFRLDHLQYYTPEFDGVGPMAIKSKMLVNDFDDVNHNVDTNTYLNESVFGFLPQYSDYAVANDNITGDFKVKSLRTDLDKFYATRHFTGDDIYHDYAFVRADSTQFDQMFNVEESFFDHFFSIFHFDIKSRSPKKSVFDTFDFELDEKGRPVPMQVGGTRLT